MFFSHLREKLESQSTVVKRIKIEDSNVIFYNEGEKYKISVDDVLLDEEFENILDAEAAVKEFLELVETEETKEIEEVKFVPTPKDLNRLSDAMKLNSIQKDILFSFMNKGKVTQKYAGKPAG